MAGSLCAETVLVSGDGGDEIEAWADDGRATFECGNAVVAGEPHIIWRRVGTHTILARP